MKQRITKIIVLLTIIIILIVGCTPKQQPFDKDKVLPKSEEKLFPQLEKDYDTKDLQVRHLSWGSLNYYPETITVKANKKVQLVGDLARLQGCFQTIVIPDLNVEGQFQENNNKIEFTPTTTGTFGFGCAMGMGKGTLIVK